MKFRVHQYVVVRVPVEIEADSIKEAVEKADASFDEWDIAHGEYAEECVGYLIDPYGPHGKLDVDNSVTAEWEDSHLIVNGERV